MHTCTWVKLLLLLECIILTKADYVTVTTEYGAVRGVTNTSQNGTVYNQFLGIPYAKPPLRDLRFKPPQSPASWSEVLDVLEVTTQCSSMGTGSEDCLYLNVFSPVNASQTPVVVWVYGGGYAGGNSSPYRYGPDFFLEHGVVVVDFNYRTGAIGFISLQNEDIPGNIGLKDMVFALQWIQRNIAAFGGDPTKVTIMGQSSGGGAVSHLFIAPAAAGLFRAAIIMSGQALAPWSLELSPFDKAYRLATSLGFQGNNGTELVQFLLEADHTELTKDDNRALTNMETRRLSTLAWAPVIEPASDTAVIVESPATIVKEGRFNHVPLLTGMASADGSVNVEYSYVLTDPAKALDMNENFTVLVGSQLQLPTEEERTVAAQRIEDYYFGEQGFTADQPQQVYDLCSDMMWYESTEWLVRAVSNLSSSPTFYYYFDYNGTRSTEYGVPHGGDLYYLFIRDSEMPNQDPESLDGKVKDLMITMWTNFIKYGEPAPGGSPVLWEPYTADAHNYMEMKAEFVQRQDPLEERIGFWLDTVPFLQPEDSNGAVIMLACHATALLGLTVISMFR